MNILRGITLFCALAALFVAGCAVTDVSPGAPALERGAKWALLPIANHTDAPQAGLRAEAIAEALLRTRGIADLQHYPAALNRDALFEPADGKTQAAARKWAHDQGVRYAVSGAVDEWRYKVGVDGEPAVGIALNVVDLQSNRVVWSAVGAKSGWSRESLAGVAQKLLRELLGGMPLK